ncbi:MAG TPA: hypothetical protein VHZ07_17160 [Bryobacteraceae bacterium]|nr:hypothetical protein [Bryobacteraceae bacterium]
MKKTVTAGLMLAAILGLNAVAQDWYHERDERYRGDRWRSHVFLEVRTDLDHVWSARRASDREHARLQRTKEELTQLQADLDHGRWDNGILNDVIDSVRKSANDDRLAPRDRQVLADDVNHLKDYQVHHNHWPH